MEERITRSPDELKVMENHLTAMELEELFKEIEAFHGVKIQVVDPKEIPTRRHGCSLDE